jgi:hypothetical protein
MDGSEVRVIAGSPTHEELCALICVLYRVAAVEAEPDGRPRPARATPRWSPADYRSPRSWSTAARGGPP